MAPKKTLVCAPGSVHCWQGDCSRASKTAKNPCSGVESKSAHQRFVKSMMQQTSARSYISRAHSQNATFHTISWCASEILPPESCKRRHTAYGRWFIHLKDA